MRLVLKPLMEWEIRKIPWTTTAATAVHDCTTATSGAEVACFSAACCVMCVAFLLLFYCSAFCLKLQRGGAAPLALCDALMYRRNNAARRPLPVRRNNTVPVRSSTAL